MSQPSPLETRLRRLIATMGAISLAQYMAEANAHYYASRDPLGLNPDGPGGDFTTAPEISQMFGEMVGVWLADVWARAGSPARVLYVEPGPGRGTLARDALGVARRFGLDPEVHFVETSPTMRSAQARLVPGAVWHDSLADVPTGAPILLVANEFLDALPIRQLVKTPRGWRERMVGLIEGQLAPVAGERPMDAAVPARLRGLAEGTLLETCPAASAAMVEIARRLAEDGGAALVIDYGYAEHRTGSTLQALKGHARHDPFAEPGEADLTALVDFAAMAEAASHGGARVVGCQQQGRWLKALGIEARAQALARAHPDRAEDLHAALARLCQPEQMGELFKVLALAGTGWPDGAGF